MWGTWTMRSKLKIVSLISIILLVFGIVICTLPIMESHISGIENYSPADSTLALCQNLFPSEDFLQQFAFLKGDYQYHYNGKLVGGNAIALAVLKYDADQYNAAKEHCVQQFELTDEHQYQVRNFVFREHLCYTSKNSEGKYTPSCQYPKIFNMFAYNDSEHILLFIGFYGDAEAPFVRLALTDFPSFYEQNFGQYYSLND